MTENYTVYHLQRHGVLAAIEEQVVTANSLKDLVNEKMVLILKQVLSNKYNAAKANESIYDCSGGDVWQ